MTMTHNESTRLGGKARKLLPRGQASQADQVGKASKASKASKANKLVALLLALLLAMGMLVALPASAYAEPGDPVCSIGSTEYASLEAAISAAQDGQTIKLLSDIEASTPLWISYKSITVDLNGCIFNNTSISNSLTVGSGGELKLTDTNPAGGGEFNVTSTSQYGSGVLVQNGGKATVTNASATNFTTSYGAYIESGSSVVVTNSATGGIGVICRGQNSSAYIGGNVIAIATGTSGYGVYLTENGTVRVNGSITSASYYVRINNTVKTLSAGVPSTTDAGYLDYTDGVGHVLVKDPSFSVDKSALALAIIQAGSLNGTIYSTESWAQLQQALSAAQLVNADTEASQEAVDQAVADLLTAIANLQIGYPDTYFRVSKGADFGIYQRLGNHFTQFTSYPVSFEAALSDSLYDVYSVDLPIGTTTYQAESCIPGQTAKLVREFKVPSKGQTFILEPTLLTAWVAQNNGIYAANMYTNLPASGVLDLSVGQYFDLDTFRAAQG
jgi:hypothetical protein